MRYIPIIRLISHCKTGKRYLRSVRGMQLSLVVQQDGLQLLLVWAFMSLVITISGKEPCMYIDG
jgi:hypothetical protein